MVNKVKFYESVRKEGLFNKLSQAQVASIDNILAAWDSKDFNDLRWLAYMLATTYHETARTMLPINEFGKGKGRPYGKKIKHSGAAYTSPDKLYYGRGYVQLTWYENYELMSRLLYGDLRLLKDPELVLDVKVATDIMFEGMTKGSSSFGDFTGKCLEMYFNSTTEDWVGVRRIINGRDKAAMIAGYGKTFLKCLV